MVNVGDLISAVSLGLSFYALFYGKRAKMEVENLKKRNNKDVDSFKIFIKGKNKCIVNFYKSSGLLLAACKELATVNIITREPDYEKCSEETLIHFLDRQRIVDADDRAELMEIYREIKDGKKTSYEMHESLYVARYNRLGSIYDRCNSDFMQLELYVSVEDDNILKGFHDKVSSFFRLNLNPTFKGDLQHEGTKIKAESDTPASLQYMEYSDELAKLFSETIVPVLRRNLRNID